MKTTEQALFAALDACGFVYSIRNAASGTRYAGFRWEAPPSRRMRSFTALFEGNTLRLTAYEPLGAGIRLAPFECLNRQRKLPIARLYLGDDPDQLLELTLAIPMEGAEPNAVVLRSLLDHLATSADDLVEFAPPQSHTLPELSGVPEATDLGDAMRELELSPRRQNGRWALDIDLPGLDARGRFVGSELGSGWFRFEAELERNDVLALNRLSGDLLNRLQLWAPVGRFVASEHGVSGQLGCEVTMALLGRPVRDAAAEALRAAIRLLGTAYRHAQAQAP